MKTMHEIKEMIARYQNTLEECNILFKSEGRSEKQKMLSEKVDAEFTAVSDAVAEHIQTLIQDLSDIDVYLMSVNTVTQYSGEPYHSYFARVECPSSTFMAGSISKHITINGFPYRS
jgi:hypothetical protein